MRQVVIHRPGGHDRLRIENAPDPTPGEGEVVVESAAIGVNYADCIVRMGLYESAKKYVGWPITPGFEVAGTVLAVGEGVRDVRPGAQVIAVTRFGGYASHVRVPRDQI
ncbi:MAG TPA: alcohol dehydrogenase catalytic domain-containing protein, partial [Polyangiaceae bacterium]